MHPVNSRARVCLAAAGLAVALCGCNQRTVIRERTPPGTEHAGVTVTPAGSGPAQREVVVTAPAPATNTVVVTQPSSPPPPPAAVETLSAAPSPDYVRIQGAYEW